MNENDTPISRGGMLQRMAVAPIAIGAFAALQAEADAAASIDKKTAAYVDHPNHGQQCSGCNLFLPAKKNPMKSDGACKLVKGSISPHGWCKFYSPKPHH
ncbi:MAG: high-potential iron-sulfur protein [Candidatus Eremiobacteraeota bacterium]|nr:high-potential iron-sulfur protein [Candidatus Eremiobacteraeota bacterium]